MSQEETQTGEAQAAPTNKLEVTFPDGTKRAFGEKQKIQKDVSDDGVSFYIRTGKVFAFALSQVSEAIAKRLSLHGAAQKIGDACASLQNPEDIEMAIDEMITRLYKGEWGAEREAGAGAGASILARAIARVYPNVSLDAVKAQLKEMSDADKKSLRANAKVAEAIRAIEEENRAKLDPKVGEDLLAKFG